MLSSGGSYVVPVPLSRMWLACLLYSLAPTAAAAPAPRSEGVEVPLGLLYRQLKFPQVDPLLGDEGACGHREAGRWLIPLPSASAFLEVARTRVVQGGEASVGECVV